MSNATQPSRSCTREAAATSLHDKLPDSQAPSAVVAAGLTLHGRRGLVYGPVDLTVPVGTMLIV